MSDFRPPSSCVPLQLDVCSENAERTSLSWSWSVSGLLGPPPAPKKVGFSKTSLLMSYKHTFSQIYLFLYFFLFFWTWGGTGLEKSIWIQIRSQQANKPTKNQKQFLLQHSTRLLTTKFSKRRRRRRRKLHNNNNNTTLHSTKKKVSKAQLRSKLLISELYCYFSW